ncbi:sensor domain-containing diguanylate cyclase [Paenibacillus whitsoniae]|uniref:Diguanylate cyclase n=1 Tax=Paenibacillus whitsoniae TaxID=2496558 RepID=A0A430J6I2_9BACL|nr:diguanylate cyclase [Paenibacillus whitsoniae]RTE03611.1 diguanylate cyclase [Paenibacillus whitsoniae]
MSEPLRSLMIQGRAEHFEVFLRQGLTLSRNCSCEESRWNVVLAGAVGQWKSLFETTMLPEQTALLCTDGQLNMVASCSLGLPFLEPLLFPGTSWKASERGDNPIARCTASPGLHAIAAGNYPDKTLNGLMGVAVPVYDAEGRFVCCLGLFSQSFSGMDELAHFFYQLTSSFHSCVLAAVERSKYKDLNLRYKEREAESKKRDILFEASKKLHAQIDVHSVLTEVTDCMNRVYPNKRVDILLSQDNDSTNLAVKPLHFQRSETDIRTRAFMEGRVIVDDATGHIAAPLTGKQGVYGVLYMESDEDEILPSDVQFLSLLADSAGTAFENAKLYEQSNLMINELRLINEITKQLNQSLRLNEIFNAASSEILSIFGADYSCLLQRVKDSERLVVQATNLPAMFHETFTLDHGFSGLIYSSREPVIISDYWTNNKVESSLMMRTKARSLIGSPIIVNGQVEGVILIVHHEPNFFSYDNYKLLQVLSSHIGLAMSNASLHAEVKRMVITDNLTGLYARHYLDEQANAMQKKDFCGSLIVVDIDNFKRVNDTYGHQVGDKILIQVSQIIKSSIRDSDIAARWGGEELAIYLPQVTKDQAVQIAERIRTRVMQETQPQVTVSCGVSDWNWDEERISVESLFYRADMALYQAKNNGRNQIQIG